MKYYKRLKIYKASNVTFDPATVTAHSYRHWAFVLTIGNKVVFNDYRYSVSTAGHQRKVARVMQELGIKVDYTVRVRESLSTMDTIRDLLDRTVEHDVNKAAYKKEQALEYRQNSRHRKLNEQGLYIAKQWDEMAAGRKASRYFSQA